MNRLKKLISILLALSMISTATFTAFAEVSTSAKAPKQNSVYCEPFGANGASNGMYANYNDTYKTITEIKPYLKEDGDYAGEIEATLCGTTSNYGDVRKVFGKNVVEDYFSITYDINFLEYDGTSANISTILKLSTRNNLREGGAFWGYGTNLFANGSSSDKVKVVSSPDNAELDTNKWYKVKQQFDGVAHKEVMTVTDATTDEVITTIERSINAKFYSLEMFSFSVCQPARLVLDNVSVNSDAIGMSGFETSYTTSDDITFEAVIPQGFGTASVYANDELIGTVNESDTNCYDVTITAGTLGEGTHTIKLESQLGDGAVSATAEITISDEIVVVSPVAGQNIFDNEVFFEVSAPKNMAITAVVDGSDRQELCPDSENPGKYSATYTFDEDIPVGSHSVVFEASKDGRVISETNSAFVYYKKNISKSYTQDFDSLASLDEEITDSNKKDIMGSVGFTFGNESAAEFAVVSGPDGDDDDKAIHIQMASDKSMTASVPFIRSSNFTNYNQGITEFEFDIKLNTNKNTQIRLTNLYLWNEAILFLVDGGKWAGTSVTATTDWTHIKYITDADKRVISMEINGERVIDNAPYGTRSEYKNTQFDFSLLQVSNVAQGGARTGFALDNFKAVNYTLDRDITVSDYDTVYTTTDDISFKAFMPLGFGSANVYADDEIVCTVDENGTNNYDITIPSGTLSEAAHTITIEATYGTEVKKQSFDITVSDDVVVLFPKDGENVIDSSVEFKVTAPKNFKISALVDGKYRSDFVSDSKNPKQYSAKFEFPSDFPLGEHEIRFNIQKANGAKLTYTQHFNYYKKLTSKSVSQDFNILAPQADSVTDDNKVGIMSRVGFTFANEGGAELSIVPGPSGEEGDVAPHVQMAGNKTLISSVPYIRSNGFTNYNEGISEIEFDIKLNLTGHQIRMTNLYLWNEAVLFLVDGGKWAGTSVKATTDWTHIKYITDADEKTISMEINGERVVDNAPYGNRTEYKNTQFDFSLLQIANIAEGSPRVGFAIDNFRAVNYKVYRGISSASYNKNGNSVAIDGCKVPYDAESISLSIPNGIYPKSINGNVKLYTNSGEEIALSDVSYNEADKTLTIKPEGKFPQGRNLTVKLSSKLKYEDETEFGSECSFSFGVSSTPVDTQAVFKAGDDVLTSIGSLTAGTVASVDITSENPSGKETQVVYVFTLRSDKRIVSMKAQTVTFASGETQKNVSLSLGEVPNGENLELCLMTLNSYTDSRATADYIKLN